MGILSTYFTAADDSAAAAAVDAGPAGVPAVDAVEPNVQARTLLALLLGRPFDDVGEGRSWARLVSDPGHEVAWVVSMPDSFTDALAGATDDRLAEVVMPWSQTEEFWGAGDPDELLPMLRAWRDFAVAARERGDGVYCWVAL